LAYNSSSERKFRRKDTRMRKRFSFLAIAVFGLLLWADPSFPEENTTGIINRSEWENALSDVMGHYPLNIPQTNTDSGKRGELNPTKNWSFDIGLQRFMVSYTSYEIGNDDVPLYHPLSRLEFPLNTWWLRFELRRTCPRWSVGLRSGLSVARNVDGRMEDSDWTNTDDTTQRTIYSQSAMRAEANYLFRGDIDVNISDWLKLPPSVEIRPLFAFQFQRLNLMAHDGVQWDANGATAIAGDGIHFRQDYYQYLIGLKGSWEILKPNKYITVRLKGEADWGPAMAYYEDHHLQREGDMFSTASGIANSMYYLSGIEMVIAKTVTLGVDADYMWLRTTHARTRDVNVPLHQDVSWSNGSEIWTDQFSLTAHVSYAF